MTRVSKYFANAFFIRDSFKEQPDFTNICDSVCENFLIRFKKLVQQVRKILDKDDATNEIQNIQKLADNLKTLSMSVPTLGGFYEDNIIDHLYKETLTRVVEHFNKVSKTWKLMMIRRLNLEQLNQLEIVVKLFNSASDNLLLQELCEMKLKDIYNNLLEAIISYFDRICAKANEMFDKNNEDFLQEMNIIHNLKDTSGLIVMRTTKDFDILTEKLHRCIQESTNDIVNLLIEGKGIDHKLNGLKKNSDWLEKLNPGVYNKIMKNIEELLKKRYNQMRIFLKQDSVHKIDQPENVLKTKSTAEELRATLRLEKCLPSLTAHRQEVEALFTNHISKTIKEMENAISNERMNGTDDKCTFDAEYFENAFIYLTTFNLIDISKIRESLVAETLNKLVKRIESYGLRLQKEIQKSFKEIKVLVDDKINLSSVEMLAFCLNKLTLMNEHYKYLFTCLNGTYMTRQLRESFTAYLDQSQRMLEDSSSKSDFKQISYQLKVVEALRILDKFCKWEKEIGFSVLFEKYRSKLSSLECSARMAIIDLIQNANFEQANLKMIAFNFTEKEDDMIDYELNVSLKKTLSEIKLSIKPMFMNVETTDKQTDMHALREKVNKVLQILENPNLTKRIDGKIDLKKVENELHESCLSFVKDKLN